MMIARENILQLQIIKHAQYRVLPEVKLDRSL